MKPKFCSIIAAYTPLRRSSLICVASLCASIPVQAAKYWTGATDGNWATTTNWEADTVPGTTETVNFNENSTGALTIALGVNRTVRGITLTSPAGLVTLAGNILTVGSGGINLSAATQDLVLNSGVAIDAGKQSWNVAADRSVTSAAVPTRGTGVAGVAQFGSTGTIKLGSAAVALLADTQGNAWGTFGTNDWAALNASGNVTAAAYTAATTAVTTGVINDIQGNIGVVGSTILITALRFDSATAFNLDVANSGTNRTATVGGILVTANCGGASIGGNGRTNAFIRPNRASGAGPYIFNVIQNSANPLTIYPVIANGSASTATLVKSGPGTLVLTGANGYSAGTVINEGVVQIGNANALGNFGAGNITNNGAILYKRSDTVTLIHNISGTGSLTQEGPGELDLTTSVSTFTGPVNVIGGTLGVTTLANLGSGTAIYLNGGTFKFLGAIDPSVRAITIGSAGATFNTDVNQITLSGAFVAGSTGALTKTGTGSLTLAAANDYTGGTTITGGKLLATAAASATGPGPVVVNGGGTLGGSLVAGAVTITSGGAIAPGSGVGTLSVGSLDLDAGSTATFEFSATPANDQITVATSGGLTMDGGALTLVQEGTTVPFTTPGSYPLISFAGTLGGAGVSALSVANPQAGFSYTFGADSGWVTLTIATSGVVSEWTNPVGGSWATAGNWGGAIPDTTGATANFLGAITGSATITLDGARTLGAITFNNGFGYTLAPGSGGTLALNNGTKTAAIGIIAGIHELSAPLTLSSTTELSTQTAGDTLTLSGVVSGSSGNSLTKIGPGALALLGANDFAGALSLTGGPTTFASGGLGTGGLTLSATTLIWAAANSQDISNRLVAFGSGAVGFDTNGNDVVLVNAIGNAGTAAFTKAGLGKLTLAADATYTGNTTIAAGSLQLGAGGTTGSVPGTLANSAELIVKLADGSSLANLVTGTGSLVHAGSGSLTLAAQNTFSGQTTISAATASLVLGDALSLQNSTLLYESAGGSLGFGPLAAATLGGLAGDRHLVLENASAGAVTLTIGSNGQPTSYTGVLSGAGSLIKTGAGVTTLSAVQTYAGATTVNGGTLELMDSGAITTTTLTVTGNAILNLTGAASALSVGGLCSVSNAGTTFPVLRMGDGVATLNGELTALGNANNGYRIQADGGTLSTTAIRLGRSALSFTTEAAAIGSTTQGLYVNGGSVSISGALELGVNALANSSVSTRVDAGSLTVGGPVTVGLNNGGRWSVLQVSGGHFTSTDAVSGVVLGGPAAGHALLDVSGGVASVERIQFGQAELAGTSVVRITSGALYLGAGGFQKGSSINAAEIRLAGGTLAASADWTTALPLNLSGTLVSAIKAASGADLPFNITLTGAVAGTGSLDKQGGGILTLGGGHAYTGSTRVSAGTLKVTTSTFADTAAIAIDAGAALDLEFTGGDRVGSLTLADTLMADGIYGSLTNSTPGIIQTAAITGSGLLYVNTDISPYLRWAGDAANGLTVGVNDGPTQDPDNDGISNLMEYVLGGVPAGAGAANLTILPTQTLTATDLVLTFHRSDLSEGDTTQVVEWSTDLKTWAEFATIGAVDALPAVDLTEDAPTAALDTVVVAIPRADHALGGKLHARLKVTKK